MRQTGITLIVALAGLLAACDGDGSVDDGPATIDGGADMGLARPDAAPPEPDAQAEPEPDAQPEPEPDAQPEPEPDPSVIHPDLAVFDPDHLIEVDVQLDPADWDTLRGQNRGETLIGPNCLSEPFPSPYDWFRARVTVDGEEHPIVGIRKKGFYGSVSGSRPSVKIRFDKYVDGWNHRGLSRLTLNNGRQDASRLRTCLAYGVFARHGVPAPRCNYARLTVNGQYLGVYAHVESLKRPFLAAHFGDPDGWLYEGTLSDFRPRWKGTMEQKTHEDTPRTAGIDRVIAALEVPDEQLIAELDRVIDLDAFFTFWASEVLLAHWDGYSGNNNNFWFYEHPADGRLRFIPWGPDATFQAQRLFFEGALAPHSVSAVGAINRRLYLHPEGRARYIARLEELVASWDPAALDAEIDRMQALIGPALLDWERENQAAAVVELRRFVDAKADAVRAELAAGGAAWNWPLRTLPCSEPVGVFRGEFSTTWRSWPTPNVFEAGEGRFEGTFYDDTSEAAGVGAAAGLGEQGEGVLIISQFFADGTITFIYLATDPARLQPGEMYIDDGVYCVFSVLDQQSGQAYEIGRCRSGRVVFEEMAQVRGAPVSGTFQLGIWGRAPAE